MIFNFQNLPSTKAYVSLPLDPPPPPRASSSSRDLDFSRPKTKQDVVHFVPLGLQLPHSLRLLLPPPIRPPHKLCPHHVLSWLIHARLSAKPRRDGIAHRTHNIRSE